MQYFLSVLAELVGPLPDFHVGTQKLDKVSRRDPQRRGRLADPSGMGVEGIQHDANRRPKASVLCPTSNRPAGVKASATSVAIAGGVYGSRTLKYKAWQAPPYCPRPVFMLRTAFLGDYDQPTR